MALLSLSFLFSKGTTGEFRVKRRHIFGGTTSRGVLCLTLKRQNMLLLLLLLAVVVVGCCRWLLLLLLLLLLLVVVVVVVVVVGGGWLLLLLLLLFANCLSWMCIFEGILLTRPPYFKPIQPNPALHLNEFIR